MTDTVSTVQSILAAVTAMGDGPLTEASVVRFLHPLFRRVLARSECYFANHSLGRPPDAMAHAVREATDHWYASLDAAWTPWLDELTSFRRAVSDLVGSPEASCVVPKTSAGQGLRAVLQALRPRSSDGVLRVVTTAGEFDSLDFILRAWSQRGRVSLRVVPPDRDGLFHVEDLTSSVDDTTDLVVVSHVFFATGQVLDGIDSLCAHARRHGARTLVDLYHAVGVLPVDITALGADFAVGGSYKYLLGGPGASWLVLAPHIANDTTLHPMDTGWFAKLGTFDYTRGPIAYKPSGDGWLESTPAVLPIYQARAGLAFVRAVGVHRLRAYAVSQQSILTDALTDRGVRVRPIAPRGAFVLVPDDDVQGLLSRCRTLGLNADGRTAPDGRSYLRLSPDVLTTRQEILNAAEILARCRRSA